MLLRDSPRLPPGPIQIIDSLVSPPHLILRSPSPFPFTLPWVFTIDARRQNCFNCACIGPNPLGLVSHWNKGVILNWKKMKREHSHDRSEESMLFTLRMANPFALGAYPNFWSYIYNSALQNMRRGISMGNSFVCMKVLNNIELHKHSQIMLSKLCQCNYLL